MILESLRCFELNIPFHTVFTHASAQRAATQTIWIEAQARDGSIGFGEGCPREYVTGESLQTAAAFIRAHLRDWLCSEWDLASLASCVQRQRAEIDLNPAAWAAVELALLDLLGKAQGQSVEAILGLRELRPVHTYSAVLGDSSEAQFKGQLARYVAAGFREFKIKLSKDSERRLAAVRALKAAGVVPASVRADANNLWSDAAVAIQELRALDFPFNAIEEPLSVGDIAGMRTIARTLGCRIILDESMLRADQLSALAPDSGHWLVNLRVSKMGGLLRALEVLREARRFQVKIIIGAHVGESSLLTRAALTIASAAGNLLVAQEGAFGTQLLATDIVDEPLMFGPGGILDVSALRLFHQVGFGLAISRSRLRNEKHTVEISVAGHSSTT